MQKQKRNAEYGFDTGRNTAGFTMVEIIIAITAFVIMLPAIAGMMLSLTELNDKARELAIVHSIVQNQVEKLRNQGFNAVNAGTVDFTNELPDTIGEPRSASYAVSLVEANDPSLKQIAITVSYNDRGETRQLHYKTYLGEHGAGQY